MKATNKFARGGIRLMRLVCVSAAVMCATAVWSQDTYKETLKAYLQSRNDTLANTLKPALLKLNEGLLSPYDEAESERLVNKYINERGVDDFMLPLVLPAFQKHLTEDQLKEIMSIYETPEGQRLKQMESDISKDKLQTVLTENLTTAIVPIIMGQTPSSVRPVKGIRKEYKNLFNQFYAQSGMDEMLDALISAIGKSVKKDVGSSILTKCMTHIKNQMPVILMNSVYDKWSMEDLQGAIQIVSKPVQKNVKAAANEMLNSLTDAEKLKLYGTQCMENYVKWLQEETKPSSDQLYWQALQSQEQGNMADAYKKLHQSASEGYAEAQTHLASWYYDGTYVVKDQKIAYEWYVKAAEQGDSIAQFRASLICFSGQGINKNPNQAFLWCQKALEQDYAPAYSLMGYYFLNGVGTPKDYKKALEYFNLAVEKKDYEGMYHIGLMYADGTGVPRNMSKAFEWMLKAGEHGVVSAYPVLQEMYVKGVGTQKDLRKSAYWQVKYEEAQK